MPKLAPAFAAIMLASGVAQASTVYVPPGAAHPRFGGEFELTEVGPVGGYWHTECYNWHVRSQARRGGPMAPPALNVVFQRFVSGLIAGKPDYADMSPAMAEAVRKNLPTNWASLNRMGRARSAQKFDTDPDGDALYVLDLAGARHHWNLAVNPDGKITRAFFCRGVGL